MASTGMKQKTNGWEPRIVAFFCNWCTYTAAVLAGLQGDGRQGPATYSVNPQLVARGSTGPARTRWALNARPARSA